MNEWMNECVCVCEWMRGKWNKKIFVATYCWSWTIVCKWSTNLRRRHLVRNWFGAYWRERKNCRNESLCAPCLFVSIKFHSPFLATCGDLSTLPLSDGFDGSSMRERDFVASGIPTQMEACHQNKTNNRAYIFTLDDRFEHLLSSS
jgi:hypothetical protein